jgi:hypothetical protein
MIILELLAALFATALGAIIPAFFLSIVADWFTDHDVTYRKSFKMMFIASFCAAAVAITVAGTMHHKIGAQTLGSLVFWIIISALLKDELRSGWGKALVAALLATILQGVVFFLIVFVFVAGCLAVGAGSLFRGSEL